MLGWALRFLLVAALAGIVATSGLSGLAEVGKALFVLSVALFVVSLVSGVRRRRIR